MRDPSLWRNLVYAARVLRLNPGFTAVAVLSLALGIGANTAIFSLIDQVVLRPLPVWQPKELVMLDDPGTNPGANHGKHSFSYPMYRDIRNHNDVFAGVIGRRGFPASLSWGRGTARIQGELVSGNYFEVLGVQPYIGRLIASDDDRNGSASPVAVLSFAYWRRQFGDDQSVVGKPINVNGQILTLVGIAPPGFFGMEVGRASDLFVPMLMKAKMTPGWDGIENRRDMWVNIFARLKPGVSPSQAESGVNVLFHQILQEEIKDPKIPANWAFKDAFLTKHLYLLDGSRGISSLRENFSAPLLVLMAFVALVLLSACANVANLLMARGAARQREIAIRLAVGASRRHVIQQLLAESILLSLVSGALGIFLAWWLSSALLSMIPAQPNALTFSTKIDSRLLFFTLGISLLTGLVFGLLPSFKLSRPAMVPTLKLEAGVGRGAHGRFRKILVVAQVALSLVLVIGAGLFAQSLYNLRVLNPGFQTDHLLEAAVDPSLNSYPDDRALALFEQLQQRLANLPGVASVSAAEVAPLSGFSAGQTISVEGYSSKPDEDMNAAINLVGASYFATMKIPVILGREFTPRDIKGAPKVGMINETAMRYWFHGANPIGHHFGFCCEGKIDIEIVGVVKDAKSKTVREDIPRYVYLPYMQDTNLGLMTFLLRTTQEPAAVTGQVRAALQEIDPNIPIFNVQTMDAQLDRSLYRERMLAMLAVFFAALAALLAAVGLYGVMAYTVSRRTSEIGIRLALGASRPNVLWLVLQDVIWMVAIGIVIAIPLVIGLSRLVQSQLYELKSSDPRTLLVATALLGCIAILAGFLPSWRATRISPTQALRYE
ncbi:MAG TPA: ABC transporter permease [Candidatus Angelobacter sp.]